MAENRAGKSEGTHLVEIEIREQRSSITSIPSIKESRPPTPTPSIKDSRPPTPMSEDGDDKGKPPKPKQPKKEQLPPGGGRRYAPEPPPDPKQQLFFLAYLTDRTIQEGGKSKISCYVQGPDPQARWFKGINIHISASNQNFIQISYQLISFCIQMTIHCR